jgi:tetratricopeptide (TPR) repeat protein
MSDFLAAIQRIAEQGITGAAASVELLLGQMPPDRAQRLRLCAIPHQYSAGAIRALNPDLPSDAAAELCASFASLAISTPVEDSPGHFTLHDQTRRHLFAQWLQPANRDRFAAASRQLLSYVDSQLDAPELTGERREWLQHRRMFHLLGFDPAAGMVEFERLFRAHRYALRWSAGEVVCQLAHEYDAVLPPADRGLLAYEEAKLRADQRHWPQADALFQSVLANPAVPVAIQIKARYRLGMVYAEQRQFDAALKWCEDALALARRDGDPSHPVHRILHELGVIHREKGDCDRATRLLQESAQQAESAGDLADLATALNSLGETHKRLGETAPATAAYERSLECLARTGDRIRAAQVYNNLGNLHADLGRDWARSREYFLRSLEISRSAGDGHNQAKTHHNLVRVLQNSGDPVAAADSCRQAIALFRDVRDTYNAARALRTLARLCRTAGDKPGALASLQAAREAFTRAGQDVEAAAVEREIALLDRRIGLPWWAWLCLGLFLLFIAAVVLALWAETPE